MERERKKGPYQQGQALNESMNQLVVNALTYYLTLREVATAESY